jgi:hypothetical protein
VDQLKRSVSERKVSNNANGAAASQSKNISSTDPTANVTTSDNNRSASTSGNDEEDNRKMREEASFNNNIRKQMRLKKKYDINIEEYNRAKSDNSKQNMTNDFNQIYGILPSTFLCCCCCYVSVKIHFPGPQIRAEELALSSNSSSNSNGNMSADKLDFQRLSLSATEKTTKKSNTESSQSSSDEDKTKLRKAESDAVVDSPSFRTKLMNISLLRKVQSNDKNETNSPRTPKRENTSNPNSNPNSNPTSPRDDGLSSLTNSNQTSPRNEGGGGGGWDIGDNNDDSKNRKKNDKSGSGNSSGGGGGGGSGNGGFSLMNLLMKSNSQKSLSVINPSNNPGDKSPSIKRKSEITRRNSLTNSAKRKSVSYIPITEGNTLITYYPTRSIVDVKYFLIPNKYIDERERMIFENASQYGENCEEDATTVDIQTQASVILFL